MRAVRFAQGILDQMPDGRGVAMIDRTMQDDAKWNTVDPARPVARKTPEPAAAYEF